MKAFGTQRGVPLILAGVCAADPSTSWLTGFNLQLTTPQSGLQRLGFATRAPAEPLSSDPSIFPNLRPPFGCASVPLRCDG